MQTPISIVIITKNEESILEDCLNAIKWCNDIVIVDSGSTDKTLEIAKKYDCRISHKDFNGFGEQKRHAVSLAKNEWVLSLDADEILDSRLQEFFQSGTFLTSETNGYELKRLMVYMNRKMIWSKLKNERILRFFNKKHGNFNLNKVHEGIVVNGNTEVLNGIILHYSYKNIEHHIEKINNYTSIAAQLMFEKNKKTSILHISIKTLVVFLQTYLIQGAILDGFAGFSWSVSATYYKALKYFKLRELHLSASKNK
jgi:glycosyltransferase involved in cell wall biosynthesis